MDEHDDLSIRDAPDQITRLPDGRQIGWREYGRADGFTVLLMPHAGSPRLVSRRDHLVAVDVGARLIALDRPGIGLSSPKAGRRLIDWPNDALAVADVLALERFALLGVCAGAPHALAVAAAAPDRVTRLALLNPNAPVSAVWWSAMRAPPRGLRTLSFWLIEHTSGWALRQASATHELFARDPGGYIEEHLGGHPGDRELLSRPDSRAATEAAARETFRHGPRGLADEFLVATRRWGIDASEIRVPTAIWVGERDSTVRPEAGRYLAATIPNARLVSVPGEAHFLSRQTFRKVLLWLVTIRTETK